MSVEHYQFGDRYWEVWSMGTELRTREGVVGTLGPVKAKQYASKATMLAAKERAIEKKRAEGFCWLAGITARSLVREETEAPAVVAEKVVAGVTRLENGRQFWQVQRREGAVTVTTGKLGATGKSKVTKHRDAWTARDAVAELLREKRASGYRVVVPGRAESPADRALERAIVAAPDDDAVFSVYADWLAERGDPRGELAAVQAKLAAQPKSKKLRAAERALLSEHRARFYGWLAPYVVDNGGPISATWRCGWIDKLTLSAVRADAATDPPSVEAHELVQLLPEVASAKFLRELVIAKPTWRMRFEFAPAIAAIVEVLPSLPLLERLTLGEFTYEDCELSWAKLGSLAALWPVAKQLTYLKLRAGSFELGKVNAPALRELRIETGGMSKAAAKALAAGKLPALETLNLWFGPPGYGCDCELDQLLPFLEAKRFPKLKHLGLANSTFGDELCERLPSSTILPQLETLDLSRSHLTTAGMRQLAAHADAFAHLQALDVSECLLDREGVKLAKTLCKTALVSDQDVSGDYEGEDYRYTAVGE